MKRILTLSALSVLGLLAAGCSSNSGSTILAEAPGGDLMNTAPSAGTYTLFHVTEYDIWGAPAKTEKVTTVNVKANERVGFDYDMPKEKQYLADANSDVIAFAGSYRKNVGPIQSINDHYYWADPSGWETYWAARPERVLAKKAIQY